MPEVAVSMRKRASLPPLLVLHQDLSLVVAIALDLAARTWPTPGAAPECVVRDSATFDRAGPPQAATAY